MLSNLYCIFQLHTIAVKWNLFSSVLGNLLYLSKHTYSVFSHVRMDVANLVHGYIPVCHFMYNLFSLERLNPPFPKPDRRTETQTTLFWRPSVVTSWRNFRTSGTSGLVLAQSHCFFLLFRIAFLCDQDSGWLPSGSIFGRKHSADMFLLLIFYYFCFYYFWLPFQENLTDENKAPMLFLCKWEKIVWIPWMPQNSVLTDECINESGSYLNLQIYLSVHLWVVTICQWRTEWEKCALQFD